MKAKSENQRPGWVRNLGFDPETVSQELNILRDKVITLEKENKELRSGKVENNISEQDLAQYLVKLHFTELQIVFTSSTPPPKEVELDLTLEEIFKHISVRISGRISDKEFVNCISSIKSGYYVDTQQALIVKSQLIAIGMLTEVEDDKKTFVKLSEEGKKEMQKLNAPKKI